MCTSVFYHKLSELNGESILKEQSITTLKKLTEILVIDDNDFTYLEALQRYEFNIKQKKDLTHLSDAEVFDVILCDIRGVGTFLSSPYEGANLIKELKTKYPAKTIIAYTAEPYNASFQKFLNYADGIMPKGTSLEDWVALLEKTLRDCADPVVQWDKTRKLLLHANVDTIAVAKYESQYVKAVKEGNFDSLKKLYGKSKKQGANIMLELTTSLLAKIIKK